MGRMSGKTTVITGGTYGFALASARRLVEEGSRVVITGRNLSRLQQAAAELGPNGRGFQADSAKIADLERLFRSVREQEGRIDVLFVNAGDIQMGAQIGSIDEQTAGTTVDTNIIGTIFTVQNALPLINDGGSIILTGSAAGSLAVPGTSIYAATKAAIRALGRVWAAELAGRNIRVNTLSPGVIATGSWDQQSPESQVQQAQMIPLKRIGKSEDIAAAALFLASDDSTYVTGTEFFVDGGLAQL